jgi:hypothetical protein
MYKAVVAGLIAIGMALGLSGCTAGGGGLAGRPSDPTAFGGYSGSNSDDGGGSGGGGGSSGM